MNPRRACSNNTFSKDFPQTAHSEHTNGLWEVLCGCFSESKLPASVLLRQLSLGIWLPPCRPTRSTNSTGDSICTMGDAFVSFIHCLMGCSTPAAQSNHDLLVTSHENQKATKNKEWKLKKGRNYKLSIFA